MAEAKSPRRSASSKGKNTDNPIRFLPVLPDARSKPQWQENKPNFILSNTPTRSADERNGIDLISELTARDKKGKQKGRSKTFEQSKQQQEAQNAINATQAMKKDRENFRKSLVDIIMQEEKPPATRTGSKLELPPLSRTGSPTAAEKDILRYYFYIHNGIDTEHVAPMEDSWLENVLRLISGDLKTGHGETIENLSDEMKEDYLLSVKKAIVDFVLKDPREKDEEKTVDMPSHREELAVVPKPWYKSFLASWSEARENLHITNPCMNQILDLWHSSFGKLRMIDIAEFKNRTDSMELHLFQNLCMRHVDAAKEKLLKKWFPEVQNLFVLANKRKQVPSNHDAGKLQSFFNCAATLMTSHLQSLALVSMSDFTDLLCRPPHSVYPYEHSGFVLRIILDNDHVKFEPDFGGFSKVLTNVYDVIIRASSIVPRIETKLYSEWNGNKHKAFLQPKILPEILSDHQERIQQLIEKESEGPKQHAKVYDKYNFLITKQAEGDIEDFLNGEHTFKEYCREVKKYKKLFEEITYKSRKVIRLGMFEVHCDELIRKLAQRAEEIAGKLLQKMTENHTKSNKELCAEYENIAEKALTTPGNTEQLMDLKTFVATTEKVTMTQMEKKLELAKDRLAFLVEQTQFSPADMSLNTQTFTWHGRMDDIFEEHKVIAQEKKSQYEDALKLRRERFMEELEGYNKQVEEFTTYGDMSEIQKYLRKAQNLDSKLQTAFEKIEAFNVEEESFGWDTTQYPQRQGILNTLKPYLQLYEMTVEFNNKYNDWMENPMMGGAEPDDVDNEVGNYWRTLYKLEKNFDSVPTAKRIAGKVCDAVRDVCCNQHII